MISSIAGVINSIHASHTNVNTGYQMDMTNTDRFEKEETNELYGKASLIGGTIYTAHNIKKDIKEITDVDNWKEFK